ncbi:MAG: pentapeptide repeat-containing protein [Desulfatibacillum sp.]|nr:pentapeptide repeat-containing protein [Desulfatibacillum sp.]
MTDDSSGKSAEKKTRTIKYEDGTSETFELRQISDEELQQVLAEHKKWLDSKGKEGKLADLSKTDLDRQSFIGVDLSQANFRKASLSNCDLKRAILKRADLRKASCSHSSFNFADLTNAKLQKASLRATKLKKAILLRANLRGAQLVAANLKGANLARANLEDADVGLIGYSRKTRYQGIRVSSCYGSAMFKAFAQHQDFLEELQTRHWNNERLRIKLGKKEFDLNHWGKALYHVWNIFADCGRTPWRWMGWSAGFMGVFGLIFLLLGENAFVISNLSHEGLIERFGCLLYYSIVTFTTLGFGDVTPANGWAALFVGIEVMIGYVMLGGLISIFATLITRRS